MRKGYFITIEGCEGSGKTTLISSIKKNFEDYGHDVVMTREPGGTQLGEDIRKILLDHSKDLLLSSQSELSLFLASRAQHIKEVILPALQNNKVVLCDRFNDSSIAYQGHARALGMDKVKDFCSFICDDLWPNMTLCLDLDPKIGLQRVQKEQQKQKNEMVYDRIESEKLSFHEKVREAYHILAKQHPQRFFLINANLPIESVLQKANELLFANCPYLKNS